MLTRTDLRGRLPALATLRGLLPRAEVDVDAVAHQVALVIDAVRDRGVAAVLAVLSVVDLADDAFIGVADELGVRRPCGG